MKNLKRRKWPFKKWEPVAVTWEDAWTNYDPISSEQLLNDSPERIRVTIGWFIGFTPGGRKIIVAMEDDRRCKDASSDCQTATEIPRSMILTVAPLKPVLTRRAILRSE